jgi:hypothetical protein
MNTSMCTTTRADAAMIIPTPRCICGRLVLGVIFVLNAYLVDWLFEAGTTLSSASAFIGAIILGYPIIVTADQGFAGRTLEHQ